MSHFRFFGMNSETMDESSDMPKAAWFKSQEADFGTVYKSKLDANKENNQKYEWESLTYRLIVLKLDLYALF